MKTDPNSVSKKLRRRIMPKHNLKDMSCGNTSISDYYNLQNSKRYKSVDRVEDLILNDYPVGRQLLYYKAKCKRLEAQIDFDLSCIKRLEAMLDDKKFIKKLYKRMREN